MFKIQKYKCELRVSVRTRRQLNYVGQLVPFFYSLKCNYVTRLSTETSLFRKDSIYYSKTLPTLPQTPDSDTNLTTEAILTIMSNAFDADAIDLKKHEVNELLESEGYQISSSRDRRSTGS
jgi:hypothetical protein